MSDLCRPRLLVLAHLPPPVHGVTVVNDALVKSHLLNERFELDVVPMRFASNFSDIGTLRLSKFLAMVGIALRLLHRLAFHRPAAVYMTPTPTGMSFVRDAMFVTIMNFFFVRKIFHLHGKGIQQYYRRSVFYRLLYRWVFWGAQVIHLSEQLSSDVAGIVPDERVHVVPNGVLAPSPPADRTPNPPSGSPVILYLSNITRLKGIFVLLDALKILADRGYDYEARIAGAPGDVQTMREFQEARTHNALRGRVHYLGVVVGDTKDRLFRNADIFIMPTLFEAFGLVAIEAMAYALPVVTSDEGSLPEIVRNGETGFVVEKGNAEKLAEAIERLLRDGETRISFGNEGQRRFQEKYTFERWEELIAGVFGTCLSRKQAHRPD